MIEFDIKRIILQNRGYSDEDIDLILNNRDKCILDPHLLNNVDVAAKILYDYCVSDKTEIIIFADYDVDGLTSGYILYDVLRKYTENLVAVYFPTRETGYGINLNFCNELIESQDPEYKTLVVTVDNGISCLEEIALLQKNNIEVVVLDHHAPKDQVPDCVIVDPFNLPVTEVYKHLAGCGVVFKTCQVLAEFFGSYDMLEYTQYVALGTIADMMPYTNENMALIMYGLEIINSDLCNLGLKEFVSYYNLGTIYPDDLSWNILPAMNACGRLQNIDICFKLLCSNDSAESLSIISDIIAINEKRKSLSKQSLEFVRDAVPLYDDTVHKVNVMVISNDYAGLAGTVANKFMEDNYIVSIVLIENDQKRTLEGSVRSAIDILPVLERAMESGIVTEYGGHAHAAGLKLPEKNLALLKQYIYDSVKDIDLSSIKIEESFSHDCDIDLNHVNSAFYSSFAKLPVEVNPIFKIKNVICIKHKASSKNPKNIEYTFKQEKITYNFWIWNNPLISFGTKPFDLYCNMAKDFRNTKYVTLKYTKHEFTRSIFSANC